MRVDGERVNLAVKEYELLVKLATEPHRVFTKEELLRNVWRFRTLGRKRTPQQDMAGDLIVFAREARTA